VSALGFNTGYIEEYYRQYLEDPNSVSESWREFFADYTPDASFVTGAERAPSPPQAAPSAGASGDGAPPAPKKPEPAARPAASNGSSAPAPAPRKQAKPAPTGADLSPLRGPAAAIASNMQESTSVPTATSVRTFAVKLMAENRALINDHQRLVGGDKVSFTHLIAYAVVEALKEQPNVNTTYYEDEEGKAFHVVPEHVNLGLAIDIEKRGKRTLLVPNIKAAEEKDFAQLLGAYNDIVRRARSGQLTLEDFQGTTASLTNPGTLGTDLSVPRLMDGQGVIVGVGSIGYPPEYHALPPDIVARTGLSMVMTITSTYDHRVIQGAESGAFLAKVVELLSGADGFYDRVFAALDVPYFPYRAGTDTAPAFGPEDPSARQAEKQARVLALIRAYRVRGHLNADVNPLGYDRSEHPELDPAYYGLTVWDLDRTFLTSGLGGQEQMKLRDILAVLRETYTRKVGVEYMHISDPAEKRWLQERIEPTRFAEPLSHDAKKRILRKLGSGEAFERFLHTKYIGHKRFSLEGAETVVPMLDALLSDAADQEVEEVVIGMAHRGRLNVLANIMGKPYERIFNEFEGSLDPNQAQGSGDVKYHLGATGTHQSPSGASVGLSLASNPSHLEAVNPIVEGMVRAKQERLRQANADAPGGDYLDAVIPLLIHGDAAFAGQGVVAETLNLSLLRGYKTGGTLHLVINNQIGFTTAPADARSSTYATDVARMTQAPVFHVNGDDPEACVRVMRLALDYRQVFNKDVVIDLLCYRVHGHNEGDEPTYTQPILYSKIEAKRSIRKLYTESLVKRGEMTPEEAEQLMDAYRDELNEAFVRTKDLLEKTPDSALARRAERKAARPSLDEVDTAASPEALQAVVDALMHQPADFNVHRKLDRQFSKRQALFDEGKIDWGFGEALAFGTLLAEGTTVRLAGQDSRRGTFSHRHSVLYDQETGSEFIPLNHVKDGQAKLLVYDSLLSEYAACAFEYGYSVADPSALVLWEAQFGDFANGAQIVFDQFLSAAEEKWGQRSSLVLLLPHGYEGQGPEHSSARLERFLQLCAEENMIVANFTTPANYFHALRRQVLREAKKPLVVMSPKSLLRLPAAQSAPSDFSDGRFQPLIPDADVQNAERLLFCSGKVYYDLLSAREGSAAEGKAAIARLEQIYPFPLDDVRAQIEAQPNAEVVWVQEEPANMGAWQHVRYQFDDLLEGLREDCPRVRYAGRMASASPSTGSAKVHAYEQDLLLSEALGLQSD
jgi:2-oxoglutarate dehydrogenase E1 component